MLTKLISQIISQQDSGTPEIPTGSGLKTDPYNWYKILDLSKPNGGSTKEINQNTEEGWVKLYLNEGTTYAIGQCNLPNGDSWDGYIYLYDITGETQLASDDDNTIEINGVSCKGYFNYKPSYSGYYMIKASSYSNYYQNLPCSLHCEPPPENIDNIEIPKFIQITTTSIEFSSDLGLTAVFNLEYNTNDGEINFEVENLPDGIYFSKPNQIYSKGEFYDEGEYSVKIIATGETQRVETYITIIKKRNRIIIDDKEITFNSNEAAKTVPINVSFSNTYAHYILTVDESNLPPGISYSNNSFISDPELITDTITREILITVESSTGYSIGDTAIYTIKVSTEDPLNVRTDFLCVDERAGRRNRYY